MIHLAFAIYDDKAEVYLTPFYFKTIGEALRAFTDSANDINHPFCKYAADFTLFQLGHFDDNNAKFELMLTPHAIGKAAEYKINRDVQGLTLPDTKGSV